MSQGCVEDFTDHDAALFYLYPGASPMCIGMFDSGLYGEGLLPARRMYLPFLLSLIDLFAKVRFTLTVVIVVWLSCMPFEEKYEWAETAQNVAAFDRTPAAAC